MKQLYKVLTLGIIIFLFAVVVAPVALAQESATATNSIEAVDATTTDAVAPSTEPEMLEGVELTEPTSIPSSFGLWWRGIRERVSVALTINPVKKAEKQLVFAEERVKLAEYITQNSTDPKVQEKAQAMLAKANEYAQKVEEKKNEFVNSTDPNAKALLRNIARHQVNQTLALDKMEDRLPADKLEQFQQFRENVEARREDFLKELHDNPNIPQDVKDKVSEVRARIENETHNRDEFRADQKELLDKVRTEDEEARKEFETMRQGRVDEQNRMHDMREEKMRMMRAQREGDDNHGDEDMNMRKRGAFEMTDDMETTREQQSLQKKDNQLDRFIQDKMRALRDINREVKPPISSDQGIR